MPGEAEFLAIGADAVSGLKEAAAVGTTRMIQKMAEAVCLVRIAVVIDIDWIFGTAVIHGRFAQGDLSSILQADRAPITTHAASEGSSLAQGTGPWPTITTTVSEVKQ